VPDDSGTLSPLPPSPPELAPGEVVVEIAASSMELRLDASADWSAARADPAVLAAELGEIAAWLQAELQCYPTATVTCQLTVSLLDARRRLEANTDEAGGAALEAGGAALEAGGAARRRLAVSTAALRVLVELDAAPNSLVAQNLDSLADKLVTALAAAPAALPGTSTRLVAAQVVAYSEPLTVWRVVAPPPPPLPSLSPPPLPSLSPPPPRDPAPPPPSSTASVLDDVTIIILACVGGCILCVLCAGGAALCHRKKYGKGVSLFSVGTPASDPVTSTDGIVVQSAPPSPSLFQRLNPIRRHRSRTMDVDVGPEARYLAAVPGASPHKLGGEPWSHMGQGNPTPTPTPTPTP
jgi:hypothetical protein